AHTGHFLLCPRANLLDHLSRRAVAFLPRLHDHERPRRVDVAGADIRAALARDPQDDARDVAALHLLEREALELRCIAVDVVEARAFGALGLDLRAAG